MEALILAGLRAIESFTLAATKIAGANVRRTDLRRVC